MQVKSNVKKVIRIGLIVIVSSLFIYATSTTVMRYVHVPYSAQMNFANEEVPSTISDVKERLDREMVVNLNLHSTTTFAIKRANRAFPIIEQILAKHGIPDDFKYLAVIESNLANAVSPAGARGVWQFMKPTAGEFGLEVSNEVDERYDLVKSTEAACQYLNRAYKKFGNWTLVAASYNAGMAGVQKVLDNQQVSSYYDAHLNEETSRYVFRILALKEIMKNPEKYGFSIPKEALYSSVATKKVLIESTISDLSAFAKEQGINYKLLKWHNPWLRDSKLTVSAGKSYIVEIPTEGI